MNARLIVGINPGRYDRERVARTADDAKVVRERVANDGAAIDELIRRVAGLAGGGGQALWVIDAVGDEVADTILEPARHKRRKRPNAAR